MVTMHYYRVVSMVMVYTMQLPGNVEPVYLLISEKMYIQYTAHATAAISTPYSV